MGNKKHLAADRKKIVNYLRAQLIGPANGSDESMLEKDEPHTYYLMGALFPQGVGIKISQEEEEDWISDDPIAMAYQLKSASVGLSFFIESAEDTPEVCVELAAATYNKVEKRWRRHEIATKEVPEEHVLTPGAGEEIENVLQGRGKLVSKWRKMGAGYLVTITLLNPRQADGGKLDPEDVIHQVWFRCTAINGNIGAYPSPNRFSWDSEEEELALIYQHKKTFAIGHGCAPMWDNVKEQAVIKAVETSFIPEYEVPPVTSALPGNHELKNSEVFSLQFLSDESVSWQLKRTRLEEFITSYSVWVENETKRDIPQGLENAAARITCRLKKAVERMLAGLKYLCENAGARECFVLANQVMLMQMVHSGKNFGGSIRDANSFVINAPNYKGEEIKNWRPFQLAFQLLTIESIGNGNSDDRDIADLIWFPTGGGKTEAYLAVAAFELFHRRYQHGDIGGGTAVILRYTLRLLTTQQFQRAATLICACERVRDSNPEKWGDEPFSLGLWVGQSTTPNYFHSEQEQSLGALQKYKRIREQDKPENPFQLLQCPWCGTRIIPAKQSDEPSDYGIHASASSFNFFCPSKACAFHSHLPVQVIDEGLYASPPSFLIGTIDKFARLALRDEPGAFFKGGREQRKSPSLILQDELHLISGPLGTIAGVYEAAMDVVMKRSGANPKYIAATATIRRAHDQVRKLYARDCMVFPPSGMTAEDSYFSREEDSTDVNPGRLYIGVMGQYHTPVTSLVHCSAALAQSAIDVELSEQAADGYWTQVIFHNSRRELGKTMTMSLDDIPKRAEVIAKNSAQPRKIQPVEMSANISSKEIPEILESLKAPKGDTNSIDTLPCTNMFSVGVDVKRLGLIMMNGQPKTTSEYIQASSRVGRDEVPGLVVAFYPNNKARDRSQYESFVPYHQALYRAVEPTSVTPYALPAMERAVHAALTIVMRYCAGLSGNDGAKNFDKNKADVASVIDKLRKRMLAAEYKDSTVQQEISNYLDACIDKWQEKAELACQSGILLRYEASASPNIESLLTGYSADVASKPEIPWPTLNSMRNVDSDCNVYVWGES
ncbi:helicase-related protein [Thalassomonas actiniarum]|uniref:DEAD/DEAH box helicase n=1 Tax=Thalassomonas actiniarum TaxID=485447 RepID=A0AAF0C553_9GAMM|nr:helicase-related protein [Thalassomonas actiniarum]WDE00736.1 DEAD/DEAH box helicase [Thalassomonas actiniarum]